MAAHPVLCGMRSPAEHERERLEARFAHFEPAMMQFLQVRHIPLTGRSKAQRADHACCTCTLRTESLLSESLL